MVLVIVSLIIPTISFADTEVTCTFTANDPNFNANAPTIDLIYPENNSNDIEIQPTCSVWANDSDGDTLTVKFYDNTSETAGDYMGWQLEIVKTGSAKWMQMDYDTKDQPHVVWFNDNDDNVWYSYREQGCGNWRSQTSAVEAEVIANTSSSLTYVFGIAVDKNDIPHIVFGNGSSEAIEYIVWNSSSDSWEHEILDPNGNNVETVKMSIDTDGQNRPHIFYGTKAPQKANYTYLDNGVWRGKENDSHPDTIYTGLTEYYSMTLDSAYNPHISFASGYYIYYANWSDENNWTVVNVSDEINLPNVAGADSHIQLDNDDLPYIVIHADYSGEPQDKTELIHFNGTGWSNISVYGDDCDYPTVAVNNSDVVFVAFNEKDTDECAVYYARYGDEFNRSYLNDTVTDYGHGCIHLMNNDSISYVGMTDYLKYAYNYTSGGSSTWTLRQTNNSVSANSTVYWQYLNANTLNTSYWWKVVVNDTFNETISIYKFDTEEFSNISYNSIVPENESWVNIDNHTMKVNLSNSLGESMTVMFYWDNHTLIGSDTNVANNTFANVTIGSNYTRYQTYTWYVNVSSATLDEQSDLWWFKGEAYNWDINRDAEIDMLDISGVASHYKETGEPHWIRADCSINGVVNVIDISLAAFHYGEEY